MTTDGQNDPSACAEPPHFTLRVSVDGAQRLIHAWKDGRLEKALGFPIAALQIHTPFAPTPPGDGSPSGPPPEEDSRPITLLPWDGMTVAGVAGVQEAGASAGSPAAPQGGEPAASPVARVGAESAPIPLAPPPKGRSGSGAKKVAVASGLVLAALVAAWLARSSPTPEATATAGTSVSHAGGLSVTPAPALPTEDAKGPTAALEGAGAQAEAKAPPEIASEAVAPALGGALPPSSGTESGLESAGVASNGEAGGQPRSKQGTGGKAESKQAGGKPRSGQGTGGKAESKKAGGELLGEEGAGATATSDDSSDQPRKKRKKDAALYSHYQCATEGAAFTIVVHGRSEAEAKASACGGSDRAACIAATSCERQ